MEAVSTRGRFQMDPARKLDPRISTTHYGKHSLPFFGHHLWGKLSPADRGRSSLCKFKRSINKKDQETRPEHCACSCLVIARVNTLLERVIDILPDFTGSAGLEREMFMYYISLLLSGRLLVSELAGFRRTLCDNIDSNSRISSLRLSSEQELELS